MQNRAKFGVGIGVIIVSMAFLAWLGYGESKTYYHTIAEYQTFRAPRAITACAWPARSHPAPSSTSQDASISFLKSRARLFRQLRRHRPASRHFCR